MLEVIEVMELTDEDLVDETPPSPPPPPGAPRKAKAPEPQDADITPPEGYGGPQVPPLPLTSEWIRAWKEKDPANRVVHLRAQRNGACIVPVEDLLTIPAGTTLPLVELLTYCTDYGWPTRTLVLVLRREGVPEGEHHVTSCTCHPPRLGAWPGVQLQPPPQESTEGLDQVATIAALLQQYNSNTFMGLVEETLSDPALFKERAEMLKMLGDVGMMWVDRFVDVAIPRMRAKWEEAATTPQPSPDEQKRADFERWRQEKARREREEFEAWKQTQAQAGSDS